MKNHKKWVYDEPGMFGLACSEIERIEEETFLELVQKMINHSPHEEPTLDITFNNLLFIESVIIEELHSLKEVNVIAEEFFRRDKVLSEKFVDIFNKPNIRAYIRILSATILLNVNWLVFG